MIVVNGRFLTQKMSGVQRFAYEITRLLKRQYGNDLIIITPRRGIIKTEDFQIKTVPVGFLSGYIWEQIELPLYLKRNGSPLLINFCNMAPVLYKNKISTIHDITYTKYPDDYPVKMRILYKIIIPRICKSSKHIITVSEFSKKEIVAHYHLNRESISVVYNAVNSLFNYIYDDKLSKITYILAYASTGQNKNFEMIFKAFQIIRNKKENIHLFVVGNCLRNEKYMQYHSDSRIKFWGRVNDDELIRLYSNAILFLYPSLYEGFGIPVIEAQACHCPVVASNVATFPEILKKSAEFVNPYDLNDMVSKILNIIDNDEYRLAIVEKGLDNFRKYSWEKSCNSVTMIIEKCK